MLAETASRNEMFLGLMFPKLEMLLKWERAPEDAQEAIVAFVGLAEALKKEKPENAVAAFDNLIDKYLETGLAKRAAQEQA